MDVVEQGRRDRRGQPRWLRGSALVVAVGLGALGVTRPHLLSAGKPAPDRPSASPSAGPRVPTAPLALGPDTSQGISLVVRQGDHLERYEAGTGRWPLATLPKGLPDPSALVQAPVVDGSGPLVGVDRGVLFRTDAFRGRSVTRIGSADRVLAPSPEPGRLFVLLRGIPRKGARVVELDARTGTITKEHPFPGYVATGPWRPTSVLSSAGRSQLLLTRPIDGGRLELALAWDSVSVEADDAPLIADIGSTTRVLGVADTRVLTVDDRPDTCGVRGCPITVRTVSGGGVQTRDVQPPPGWIFGTTVVGGAGGGDPLALVFRFGGSGNPALARLLPGSRVGLLVGGTDGLVESIRPVGGQEGIVLFAVPRPEGTRVSVWLPGARSAALLLDLPALKAGAELVCACR
jgi:hypothetical protein